MSVSLRVRLMGAGCALVLVVAVAPAGSQTAVASPGAAPATARAARVHGFRQAAAYLDDTDRPMGGRWIHERTGFTLDLLEIQSVPQGFIWVRSFPTSDKGEPHTQEHLLLSKGDRGRAMASLETMALSASSAFTQQLRTAYHFNTSAGAETFYTIFERRMDALLHPNYSDEEIRREVRNFGISVNPADSSLRMEEKGTVYNEMSSTYDRAGPRLYRVLSQLVYGERHPMAWSSGGTPEALRVIEPRDIRTFHAANYHLPNMGMVTALPKSMPTAAVLERMNGILTRLEAAPPKRAFPTEKDLPRAQPAPRGAIRVVGYPHRNPQQPGNVMFVWPASREGLAVRERLLLQLFLSNLAGDPTTNLYKAFVDTRTRRMDVGATALFASVGEELGHPVTIGLVNAEPRHMTETVLDSARRLVAAELARVAALPDGAPELTEFNTRLKSRVIQLRRDLAKFVNSPPGFGLRNTFSAWMRQLDDLEETGGLRRSVTQKPDLAWVDSVLARPDNVWRDRVARWKLSTETPYVVAARPDPELIARDQREREARVAAELARLRARYRTADDQATVRRYRAEYDSATAALEREASRAEPQRFVSTPPMTLDDELEWRLDTLRSGVPLVTSTFESMTSATTGVALRLDGVEERDLVYLSQMPALLTQVGVIENGVPVPYERMSERLKREVLSLNATFAANPRTGRAELVVRGAGNDVDEARRAIGWMRLVLTSPDWRPENLARIRDVVDQANASLRTVTQGSEESWVNGVATAYRRQDSPLLLTATSFMTQSHNALRLRWLLRDAGAGADREAIAGFLARLGAEAASASRTDLTALLVAMRSAPPAGGAAAPALAAGLAPLHGAFQALPAAARAHATQAAADLEKVLADVPDATLAADWTYLCSRIRSDLLVPPAEALARLDVVRRSLLSTGGARAWMVGSRPTQTALAEPLNALVGGLAAAPRLGAPAPRASDRGVVTARLRERARDAVRPVYVGLVQPSLQSGVFLNSAPLATYSDTARESVLRYLASKLYAGGGAHGVFMKTWGAGLAYSNGLGGSPGSGRITYYAERTPELPQTLRFVIGELKSAKVDTTLADYALAVAFGESRAALSYEARNEAIAADLADGLTPDAVRRFRRALLAVRTVPRLADSLFARMGAVYATVLPGFAKEQPVLDDAVYMVIGSERQLTAWEEYLKTEVGGARLDRLYPRDFWLTTDRTMQ